MANLKEQNACRNYISHRNKAQLARDLKKTKTTAMHRAVDVLADMLEKEVWNS